MAAIYLSFFFRLIDLCVFAARNKIEKSSFCYMLIFSVFEDKAKNNLKNSW